MLAGHTHFTAACHPVSGPFDPEWVDAIRLAWCSLLPQHPQAHLLTVPIGQPFALHLQTALMHAMGDPHAHLPGLLADGVPLGVDVEIPNVPDVWPSSRKRSNLEHLPLESASRNYNSCNDNLEVVRGTLREDA